MSAPVHTATVPFVGQYNGTNRPTIKWPATLASGIGGPLLGSEAAKKIKSIKISTEMMGEIDDQTDENSTTIGFTRKTKGPKKRLKCEAVVQADNAANAATALVAAADLSEIALGNFVSTSDTQFNGSYVYKTGMLVELGEDDTAKLSWEMYQHSTTAATLLAGTS